MDGIKNIHSRNVFCVPCADRGEDVQRPGAFRGLEGDQGTETRPEQPVPGHGAAAPELLQTTRRAGDQDSSEHAVSGQGVKTQISQTLTP